MHREKEKLLSEDPIASSEAAISDEQANLFRAPLERQAVHFPRWQFSMKMEPGANAMLTDVLTSIFCTEGAQSVGEMSGVQSM
jgi:hypothetical protein